MAFMTNVELQKEQALSEGYSAGPLPQLNSVNINTQDALGNTIVLVPPSLVPPYYPLSNETPNLNLSLTDMNSTTAENFCLIDDFIGSAVFTTPGNGGTIPFFIGGIQDHTFQICAKPAGVSTANAIAYARLFVVAPINVHDINFSISDAGGASSFGSFAIYSADGKTLLGSTTPFSLASTGVGSGSMIQAPVFVPQGPHILAWTAYGEGTAGTAKLTGLLQNTLTTISNKNYANVGDAGNVAVSGVFPATLGTLTTNNNYTAMPLLFIEL
jgi:hypothetical protein